MYQPLHMPVAGSAPAFPTYEAGVLLLDEAGGLSLFR